MIKPHSAKTVARSYWPVLVPILLVTALQLGGSSLFEYLRYDREAIFAGQVWRLISGHLLHLSWMHLLLNIAGLLLLTLGFATRRPLSPLMVLTAFSALILGVSAGLLLFNPELAWYVGLSGVLHGVAVLIAFQLWPRERLLGLLLFAGLLAKVAWEQVAGADAALGSRIGGAVIVDAHLYGLISGVLVALFFAASRRWNALDNADAPLLKE